MFKLFKRFVLIFLILSIFLPASVHAEGGKFLVHGTVYRGQDMPAPGWRPRGAEIVVYTTTDGAVLGTAKSGENGAYSLSFTVVDDQQVKVVAEESFFGGVVGRAELTLTTKVDGFYNWTPHLELNKEWIPSWMSPR